jgi:hypothetical protein
MDSPATTSELTYTFRWRSDSPTTLDVVALNRSGTPATITLMEIAQ